MNPLSASLPVPCHGYRRAVMFLDVEPEVLAREAAVEQEPGGPVALTANPWQTYLQRVLPALERDLPAEMAQALLLGADGAGTRMTAARRHAAAMRRRSVAAGDVRHARFWGDVLAAIGNATE